MVTETHSQIASFIWSICNLLRGPYKRNEYRKVILPLTVLRRFDCILAPTKAAVLKEHASIKAKGENIIRHRLSQITKVPFYNLSKFTLGKPDKGSGLNGLLDDPNHLAPNLNSYINGFSPNVRAIMERFALDVQIAKMAEKDLLYLVIQKFAAIDLSPGRVDNVQMGYVFEELIRIGAEQSNEEAGEHFTPREVIKLMVNLLLSPEKDLARSHVVKTIYDPACGTGGMLSVAEKYIRDLNSDAQPKLFGQDWNDEAWAVCKSDMLIKGEDADNIIMGDTFTKDGFDRTPDRKKWTFDYMLANPPFGVEWKQQQRYIENEKDMVVTSSRLHAVRYMQAFGRYIADNKITDVRPLVAFSGTVKDPETGLEYTEPGMNADCVSGKPISERQLPERFASLDYQVLLVANKYQTGFDQPLLCAMYVDKRLDGVQAVQTLSRLNRKIPGKESPFVLDFVNEAEDIYKAFKPYYDATGLQEESDPQQLEQLKHELDAAQVYFWSEVEAFARVFYKPLARQSAQDHAGMQLHLQPAVDRFKAMEDEAKRSEFREKLNGYVNIYSFMSQIMPYSDPALEMLYSFGRFLLPHLPLDRDNERVKVGDEVGLQYYRLQRIYSGEITLKVGEPEPVKSPTDVGTGKAKDEKAPLSEIIKVLNERFGTNFREEDRFFFEQIREKATANEQVVKLRRANPFDKFQLGLKKLLEDLMVERMADNDKIVTRYMDDKEFGDAAFTVLSKAIYDSIPTEDETPKAG